MNIGLLGGRLMRAAICGLLAATVLPAIASAAGGIVGGVTLTTPSTPTPVVSVTVSAPTVSASTSAAASTTVATPVASASISASAGVSASVPNKSVTPRKMKPRKKAQRNAKRGASALGGSVRTFLDSTTNAATTTAPFGPGVRPNDCIPEFVVWDNDDAQVTTTTQVQPDGTLKSYIQFHGTGLGASDELGAIKTGSVYSFSDELHVFALGGPGDAEGYSYHYEKLIRRGEVTGTLDDSYLRVAFRVIGGVLIPDLNRSGFECR